jgi:hypothetical protein
MSDKLQRLLQNCCRVDSKNRIHENTDSSLYAESVGKFQPRVAPWQPWEKESEENHRNSEGVAVFVSNARRDSFRVAS